MDGTIIISYFGGSNNIFADCRLLWLIEYYKLTLISGVDRDDDENELVKILQSYTEVTNG